MRMIAHGELREDVGEYGELNLTACPCIISDYLSEFQAIIY